MIIIIKAKVKTRMATRTAPVVNGTGTFVTLSIRMIDASGDVRTVSLDLPSGVADTDIETHVDALQAATNASVYAVSVQTVYNSVPDPQNATAGSKSESVFDNLVLNAGNATKESRRGFIPAPVSELFTGDSDDIEPSSLLLVAYLSSLLVLINQGLVAPAAFDIKSARYTERREINSAIKF